ncbi:MAG: hypothetical protein LBU18_06145 [Treponema sp.]|jgi:hypothetical protein|nr:hypothetical protein [Treponema sp.]
MVKSFFSLLLSICMVIPAAAAHVGRRVGRAVMLIFFGWALVFTIPAQEDGGGEEIPVEPEWTGPLLGPYAQGDFMFTISAGMLFPVLFLDETGEAYNGNIKLGGQITLGLNYFLSPNIFLGAELVGAFSNSVNNMILQFPFGFRAGYQFIFRKLELPVSFMIGAISQNYITKHYLGLFLKPEAAVYWRFNTDWSFGVNAGWWLVPEWPKDGPEYNRYGNFLNLTISARYVI